MARYLIIGDIHGHFHDLNSVMKNVDFNLKIRYDAVIQVGDFGFYPQCFEQLDKWLKPNKDNRLEYARHKFHKPVYAICGNHEQHKWLRESNKEEWKEKYNIFYQPRGSYLDIDGYKIGFLGGALNADRPQEGSIDKRTTNYILNNEASEAVDLWNSVGGMDTIITHSCPNNIGVGMVGHPALIQSVQQYCTDAGHDPGDFTDCGEAPLRSLYHKLDKKPSLWFYGHFHTVKSSRVGQTEFICVGSGDSSDGCKYTKPFILDTKKRTYEHHNKMAMNFDGEHSTRLL